MLWYKGWLETRLRLCMALGFPGFMFYFLHSKGPGFAAVQNINPIILVWTCTLLAGAGIATQPAFQATKGLHGSTLFTLTLPVSRFRLLAVRAGIGWLETAVVIGALCCEMWLVSPFLRTMVTAVEMLEYAGTVIACASVFYFLSVLLDTFLDQMWRIWGTFISFSVLWWLSLHTRLPASVDIFREMGKGSPLITHTIPLAAIAFSLVLSAILFFVALKVAQTREY
jgi:ABC-2 type transport system permease protein